MRFRMGGIGVLRCGIVDYRVMAESMKEVDALFVSKSGEMTATDGFSLI